VSERGVVDGTVKKRERERESHEGSLEGREFGASTPHTLPEVESPEGAVHGDSVE